MLNNSVNLTGTFVSSRESSVVTNKCLWGVLLEVVDATAYLIKLSLVSMTPVN